jgi:hypothetical protein
MLKGGEGLRISGLDPHGDVRASAVEQPSLPAGQDMSAGARGDRHALAATVLDDDEQTLGSGHVRSNSPACHEDEGSPGPLAHLFERAAAAPEQIDQRHAVGIDGSLAGSLSADGIRSEREAAAFPSINAFPRSGIQQIECSAN